MQQSHLIAACCVWFKHHVTAMMTLAFSMQQCMPFCVYEQMLESACLQRQQQQMLTDDNFLQGQGSPLARMWP